MRERVIELKHHLLPGREASLRPTITGSPAAFLRHWTSLTGERCGLLHTANSTRVGMVLLPAGSEVIAQLWTDSPSCFYLGFFFFLQRLNPDFFFLFSLLRFLWKVKITCLVTLPSSKETTCAVLVRRSAAAPKTHLLGKYHFKYSPGWITSLPPLPYSSFVSRGCDDFDLTFNMLLLLLHQVINIFSAISSAPKRIHRVSGSWVTHTHTHTRALI